jgi:Undecaprenyl-phosphate galactose phosphotransferase WbaP
VNFLLSALALMLTDVMAWVVSFFLSARPVLPALNLWVLLALWLVWFGLLRRRYFRRQPFWSELLGLIKGTVAFMALGSLSGLLSGHPLQFLSYLAWGTLLVVMLVCMRALVRKSLIALGLWDRKSLIFGAGENAKQAALALRSEPNMGYVVESFVVPAANESLDQLGVPSRPWPESEDDFVALRPYKCVIALEASQSDLRDHLIRQLSQHQIRRVSVIPSMRGVPLFGLDTTQFFSHEVLMIHLQNQLAKPIKRAMKRLFDLSGSALLLLLLSPLFAYVAYKVSRDGGSAFFGHERVGQGGKAFKCYKFRSMVVNAQEVLKDLLERDPVARAEWEKDFKLKNDPRVNPIGHFLRRTSLDELPQLWNVLRGEMSLVGPRPVVLAELERYGGDVVYYLMAKPGMTGLWQVSGRNDVDYDTRVYFDAWYVKNWSLWTDIAILFKTISVVMGA